MLRRVCEIFPSYSFSSNVAQVTVMHMSQTSAFGDVDACFYSSDFLDSLYIVFFNFQFLSFSFVSIILILTLRCLTSATFGVVELFFLPLFVDTYPLRTVLCEGKGHR